MNIFERIKFLWKEIERAEDKITSLIYSQYTNEISDMPRGSRQNRIQELFVKIADKDREYKKLQNDLRKVKEQMIDLFYEKIKNHKHRNIMVDYYIFREDVEVIAESADLTKDRVCRIIKECRGIVTTEK